jgi:hypothetical protein
MADQDPRFRSTPEYHDSTSRIGDFLRYPRRVLIQALEAGFGNPYFYTWSENEQDKEENRFLYVKDESGDTSKDSKIEIADGYTEELNSTNPRPIILCTRDSMTFQDSSIGGLKAADLPWFKSRDFADLITIPLVFQCFSRKDVESEELGLVTALFFRMFRETHLKNTRLQKMGSPVIGAPSIVETDSRLIFFVTPVSFPVTLVIGWRTKFLDLKDVKDVAVTISLPKRE